MKIGTVKEIKCHEYRVGLTPACVKAYCTRGNKVMVEKGAGRETGFEDSEYVAAGAVIVATRKTKNGSIGTGEAYDAYKRFCQRIDLRPLTGRAFGDLVSELDIYSLIRSRVLSRGRYGRTREIILDLPQGLTEKIYGCVLLNFEIHD